MTYIIMADGRERRWKNHQGIHKWQIKIGQQTILERTCCLLRTLDPHATIYITSHDTSLQIPGAVRYEPKHNVLEIDRFTAELIGPDVCFLYGDSFYSEAALKHIVTARTDSVLAFGSRTKIFAMKVADEKKFRYHLERVRELFLQEKIQECIGWEIYHSLHNLPLESREIGDGYVLIEDETRDFNSPEDWMEYRMAQGLLSET